MLIKIENKIPIMPYYISEDAVIIGDVRCLEFSSVWFKSILRADINYISLGKYSNIQDMCVCHVTEDLPVKIGDYVTIGHGAILHGCEIDDYVLIGMGSTILDGAKIGMGSIVAAGSVIKERTVIPPFSLVAGVPASVKKDLNKDEIIEQMKNHAVAYYEYAKNMKNRSEIIK